MSVWASQLGETVKSAIRRSMMANRRHEIQFAIDSIASQAWISKIRIFGSKGNIVYSSDKDELGRIFPKDSRECISCHGNDKPLTTLPTLKEPQIIIAESGSERLFSSVAAITNEPDCYRAPCHVHPPSQKVLGVFDLLVSLKDFDKRIVKGTRNLMVLSFISIIGLCLLISVLVRYQVVKPIKVLLAGTEMVADGRFNYTIPVYSKDELGALSHAFNKMTGELRSYDGDLRRWVITLEDKVKARTMELERTRMQLVQQEKMASLGRLAAGVAHEINNPLTSILLFSTILKDMFDPGDMDYYKKISTIVSETIRCREIVQGLLEFSHQDQPKKIKQNINEVIEKAVSLIRNQAVFHNIKIDLLLSRNLPEISVDANQIQQVFFNILINAADAMPNGGELYIRSYLNSSFVVCEFKDNGKGIPEENIPRIFDPFFSTKKMGTGLGLSISYGIIQRHAGKIEVKSKENVGTTFIIKLPIG